MAAASNRRRTVADLPTGATYARLTLAGVRDRPGTQGHFQSAVKRPITCAHPSLPVPRRQREQAARSVGSPPGRVTHAVRWTHGAANPAHRRSRPIFWLRPFSLRLARPIHDAARQWRTRNAGGFSRYLYYRTFWPRTQTSGSRPAASAPRRCDAPDHPCLLRR